MADIKNNESVFQEMFVTRTHGFIDISKKRSFWQDLADEFGGVLKIKQTVSKDLERLIMQIPYKQHIIEFTESDIHPLKINCVMSANCEFEFIISYEDTIEKLLKLFGQQDIEVGDKAFDEKYLIKEKKTSFAKQILSENEIKTILLKNNVFSFGSNYRKEDNTLELFSLVSRTVNSKAEMSELFRLFCLMIDKMEELDIVKRG